MTYKYNSFGTIYNARLEFSHYANNRTAMTLVDDEGQIACATVNLPEYDLKGDEILIKTWSENEGMLDFLTRHKIVEDLGRDVPTGYVSARVCRLLVKP